MATKIKKKNKKNEKKPVNRTVLIAIIACVALFTLVLTGYAVADAVQTSRAEAEARAAAEAAAETALTSAENGTEPSDVHDESDATHDHDVVSGDYIADITVENYGTISVFLEGCTAPITVNNFVELARSGFYDGLTFHRIMDGFMMQGGDPEGTGSGGSGTNIVGEFSANGYDNDISHTRGTISMARATDYDSASSQFFIVQSDSTFLDGQYAGFGYVIEGMEYVDAICADAQPTDNNGTIPADQQPVITSIVIRDAA